MLLVIIMWPLRSVSITFFYLEPDTTDTWNAGVVSSQEWSAVRSRQSFIFIRNKLGNIYFTQPSFIILLNANERH